MVILSASRLSKSYGVTEVFADISFFINKGDRVGIVGANGAGKTTLLGVLSGEIPFDFGEYSVAEHCRIGYLKQNNSFASDKTIYDEMLSIFDHLLQMEDDLHHMSQEISELSGQGQNVNQLLRKYDDMSELYQKKGGYTYKSELLGILNSMGFPKDYLSKPVSILSGGEKTRLALAGLLLRKPDLLFLDEPTNHLDVDTLRWLEQYLKSYEGSIILISHDRYFLDQTVSRIFEIENKGLKTYNGNYTDYIDKKKASEDHALALYESQQKEIAKQEEMIRRFKQHGTEKLAKRARSRENALARMQPVERPSYRPGKMKIHFKQGLQSGNDVLHVENLTKRFDHKLLFQNVSFDIKRGQKVSLVGPNGIGKTTLLRLLLSLLPADGGLIKPGFHVHFGYYDQGQEQLNPAHTILDEMHSAYRLYNEQELRGLLGRFLFKGDDVYKPVSGLSGGEKARLSLLKLMLSGANFLIMDEPTNHLDIQSREVFEDALLEFPGTVLFVSHDRYFLNKVSSLTLELNQDGMKEYLGNYSYYIERKGSITSAAPVSETAMSRRSLIDAAGKPSVQKENYRKSKEAERELRIKKKEIARYEEKIKQYEDEIVLIEQEMCREDVFSDYEKMAGLHDRLTLTKQSLDEVYECWLELLDGLEEN